MFGTRRAYELLGGIRLLKIRLGYTEEAAPDPLWIMAVVPPEERTLSRATIYRACRDVARVWAEYHKRKQEPHPRYFWRQITIRSTQSQW